jgi:hypothetical protein
LQKIINHMYRFNVWNSCTKTEYTII